MSHVDIPYLLDKFIEVTRKPVNYLRVQDDKEEDFRMLTKATYDYMKIEEKNISGKDIVTDALPELIIKNFDEEQIWQEINLQNVAHWDIIIDKVSSSIQNKNLLLFPVVEKVQEKTKKNKVKKKSEEVSTDDLEIPVAKKQKKVSKVISTVKRSVVDDEFFKLGEMEKFLDAEDKKENFQRKSQKNTHSDDESVDLFEDQDSELSDEDKETEDRKIKYEDFFVNDNTDTSKLSDEPMETDSEQLDEDFNEMDDGNPQKSYKKSVRFNTDKSSDDNSDNFNELSDNDSADIQKSKNNADNNQSFKLSEYEIRQLRLGQKISKLEEKNLSDKPWQLKGEVDASSRPQNSLLEEVVDFDLTARPVPIITEETTLRLEDIIKQRVKDKVWDDVERRAKPVQEVNEFRKTIVLDQEKSKMSLAQVYEQEYLKQKQMTKCDNDQVEEEPKEHQDIRNSMEKLFAKLDALSNYHFTPKAAQPEVKIVSNIPAISMEEVAPVATSDAALLAPEEVKSKGELMSKSERTDTDKKRERRKKKLLQKDKKKSEKIVEKLNPGLGNKYSKDKAKKLLNEGSDKLIQLSDPKILKSSKAFFGQLTDNMTSSIKPKNKGLLPAKKYKL